MAMPKTTETRCRNGSVQATHVLQRLPHPYIFSISFCELCYETTGKSNV